MRMGDSNLYHEQQRLMRCALHTLNNLLQEPVFTKEKLDEIAHRLAPESFINPHKNFLGLGNYDINVMIAALQEKGYSIQWWDKRKDLKEIPLNKVFGLIVNYVTWKWLGLWESRHWFPMRPIDLAIQPSIQSSSSTTTNEPASPPVWYSFNSSLSTPYQFANSADVIPYLKEIVANKKGEVLLVLKDPPAAE